VHYLIGGKVAIVKDAGTSSEQELDVITRGSCIGDWGVVNEKLRAASCIARTEVEVLMIRGANFQALADDALLSQITDGNEAAGAVCSLPDVQEAPETIADETPTSEDYKKGHMVESFKLISRREKKEAGAAMKRETDEMCKEGSMMPLVGASPILAAAHVSTKLGSERVM
jgi:CRP-like cAMP-binding protein